MVLLKLFLLRCQNWASLQLPFFKFCCSFGTPFVSQEYTNALHQTSWDYCCRWMSDAGFSSSVPPPFWHCYIPGIKRIVFAAASSLSPWVCFWMFVNLPNHYRKGICLAICSCRIAQKYGSLVARRRSKKRHFFRSSAMYIPENLPSFHVRWLLIVTMMTRTIEWFHNLTGLLRRVVLEWNTSEAHVKYYSTSMSLLAMSWMCMTRTQSVLVCATSREYGWSGCGCHTLYILNTWIMSCHVSMTRSWHSCRDSPNGSSWDKYLHRPSYTILSEWWCSLIIWQGRAS